MSTEIYLLLLSAFISLLSGYFLLYVSPRSKIIYWLSHYSSFDIKSDPNTTPATTPEYIKITTSSLIIQNTGSKQSENIEIVHASRPDMFKFFLPIDYTEGILSSGHHVIRIHRLATKETISLSCLWTIPLPNLIYVRSENGIANQKNIISQPVRSKLFTIIMFVINLIGIFASTYWIGRAIYFIRKNIQN